LDAKSTYSTHGSEKDSLGTIKIEVPLQTRHFALITYGLKVRGCFLWVMPLIINSFSFLGETRHHKWPCRDRVQQEERPEGAIHIKIRIQT
jgi:hypothetical protein